MCPIKLSSVISTYRTFGGVLVGVELVSGSGTRRPPSHRAVPPHNIAKYASAMVPGRPQAALGRHRGHGQQLTTSYNT